LIFARSAHLDARSKGLSGSEHFLDELTLQAIQKARRTGFPCFHFDENSQVGDTFGQRLGNAMNTLYAKGVEHLIVIGNDSPNLQTQTLLKAISKLREGHAVLGPSADGGTYLIGLSRPQFDLDSFIRLPWQTSSLLQGMVRWNASRGGHTVLLQRHIDLDSLKDCLSWQPASRYVSSRLGRLLLGFAASPGIGPAGNELLFSRIPSAIPFNKGSPL
jgi:glycosyltransferase A (GT-A) superfamily protein (DUF2064 family)